MTLDDNNNNTNDDEEDDKNRRDEEEEALQAFYGDGIEVKQQIQKNHRNNNLDDKKNHFVSLWTIRIVPGIDLELFLPIHYPSRVPPTPNIRAPIFVLDKNRKLELEQELLDMYQENTEIAILWTEHLKSLFDDGTCPSMTMDDNSEGINPSINDDRIDRSNDEQQQLQPEEEEYGVEEEETMLTFQPSTSRFGQPSRRFDMTVLENESNRRIIHRGQPFHPPKSGPSELMIAHVASVECMDHIHWVLGQLLFHDKKVARASHNMLAYRFWDTTTKTKDNQHHHGRSRCLVSDNDDDGEKGAGAKLALLLDMANVQNVLVVVSRWYGGIHLGSSRFKHIAHVARDALQEAGFIHHTKEK